MSKYKFKIRASSCGKIMASAGKAIPVGAKTYCKEWLIEKIYNRRKEISGKALKKGNECEDLGIELLADYYGFDLAKNEEYKENDYLTGTCDVIHDGVIYDIKNPWDCFTMPLFDDTIKNKDYEWQLQCYMELYDCDNAELVYTLNDTPEDIVNKEIFYKAKELCSSADEVRFEVESYHTYSDLDEWKRVKIFKIKRDKEKMKLVKERVEQCQEYIDGLIDELSGGF